ncbi:protein arginine kinase [Lutibacter sp. B2]|nr:protein arginine kinase [Lutibacter sp. B2]
MTKWIDDFGAEDDVIVSSRVRLARNIEDIPFPVALVKEKSQGIFTQVQEAISEGFTFTSLEKTSEMDRKVLVEKHLISPNLIKDYENSAIVLNEDESISIMINEEDHIRIQSLLPGFQLDQAYKIADEMDDKLEQKIKYAFDEKIGYLTSCPTNVGTGMRASVMAHLPALTMTRYISKVLQAANQIGLAVRGLYGEGTEVVGNMFQISNQMTLGRSEREIIGNLKDVMTQIIQKERDARATLLANNKIRLEDKIYRSFGILYNARILSFQECMKLISDIRLGVALDILKDIDSNKINRIMVMSQHAYVQKNAGKSLGIKDSDIKRATLVRRLLGNND